MGYAFGGAEGDEEVAKAHEGEAMTQDSKCHAEDPNNCRFHHTGRFAQCKASLSPRKGAGEIPPPFNTIRLHNFIDDALKNVERVSFEPTGEGNCDSARDKPVAEAIQATWKNAERYAEKMQKAENMLSRSLPLITVRLGKLRRDNLSLARQLSAVTDEEDAEKLRNVIAKNQRTILALFYETQERGYRVRARVFGEKSDKGAATVDYGDVSDAKARTAQIAIESIFSSATTKGVGVKCHTFGGNRSESSAGVVQYNPYEDSAVLAHEIAHEIERQNPHVLSRCIEFLDYRCGDEKSIEMSEHDRGNGNFREGETARKDKFFHAYCGKDYFDANGKRGATEILSCGVEALLKNPVGLYSADKEYFAFIVNVAKGVI